ncbi:MAG: hypothetical protein ACI89X_002020 [Planctomycetota bacterium]|jgi:hypothetical protein
MAVSKGMPLLAVIAGIMVVSYTVFRLNYAANNLPYDPGDPWTAVDVKANSAEELSTRMRETFLARHSVRLCGVRADGTPDESAAATVYEAWPLRGLELERAIRFLDKRIEGYRSSPIESRDTDNRQRFATHLATRKLIDQDRAWVVDGDSGPIESGVHWQIWSLLLFEKKDRRRWLYSAVNSDDFDFVKLAPSADPKTFDPR